MTTYCLKMTSQTHYQEDNYMSRNEINVVANMITGRQGWAYVCNSGKFPVIDVDLNLRQEYETYLIYSKVRLAWEHRGQELYKTCTVAHQLEDDDNKDVWELTSGGACLSSSFTYGDAIQMMNEARLPIVRKGEVAAIITHSQSYAFISLVKVTHVDINCMTTAILEPLTDDEMAEFVKDANAWCNR